MPISNKASQNRMTKTTIRLDSKEAQRRQQPEKTQRTTTISNNNNDYQQNTNDSYPYKTRTVVRTETPKILG
jgi:hypothetical protein